MKKFNIFYGDEHAYSKDMIFKKTENGFDLLDSEGNPIIRAYDVETTGEFHVYIDHNLFNGTYTTLETSEKRANPLGWVKHFEIVRKKGLEK